ncbi:MAG: hypothetical protein JKX75_00490 [Gammaproteobacteria bacterium]|nr:hypothetical protein [Gammaproteobacteria bacterium]
MASKIYEPALAKTYLLCSLIVLVIIVFLQLSDNVDRFLYCVVLISLLVLLMLIIKPIVVNQKLSVSDDQINIFQNGEITTLIFCQHIDSIFFKKEKLISYRFKYNKKKYEIFPGLYKDRVELVEHFETLIQHCEKPVAHKNK